MEKNQHVFNCCWNEDAKHFLDG